jgi:hypothetical protein
MPSFSFRSIIEILLPGDLGSGLANFILWPTPFLQIPLIFAVPVVFGLIWFWRANKGLCIAVCVLLYIGNIFTQSHSKYHSNFMPYTVPVDQTNPGDRPAPSDYTTDGRVWQDDYALQDAATPGWNVIGDAIHPQPVEGKISQEEATYEFRFMNEANYLIRSKVISPDTFISISPSIRDYLLDRQARLAGVTPGLNSGFLDRYHSRVAIDKINAENTPLTYYINARDTEQDKVGNEVYAPIFYGLLAFFIFGFAGKYGLIGTRAFRHMRGQKTYGEKLAAYNHARTVEDATPVMGPFKLIYPVLSIGGTPFNLEGSLFDKKYPYVLHLKSGASLYFYHAAHDRHEDKPVPKKPKFTWDFVAPKKEVIKPAPGRPSIFLER